MATYAATLAEGFSQKVVSLFFEKSIAMDITNQDYEGEIKDKLSKLNILTFGAIGLKIYNGSDMTPDDATESVATLETNVQKAYYFKILSLQKFHSWIKNPEGSLVETVAKTMKQEIDSYVLGFGADVAAGNRVGTDVTSGTITVTDTSGAFTIAGATPLVSGMVGKGIKAVGHTKWYRIKTISNTTEGVMEDDLDDTASAYTGGAISGGTAYVIESSTKVQVAYNTLYGKVALLQQKLNEAQVPMEDRYLVVPPAIYALLVQADVLTIALEANNEVIRKGYVGELLGFKVYMSNQVAGNNTDGYQVLALHKSWLTFAMGWVESGIEDLIGNFGKAYKGLNIYGAKVVDERRKAAALGLFYI